MFFINGVSQGGQASVGTQGSQFKSSASAKYLNIIIEFTKTITMIFFFTHQI